LERLFSPTWDFSEATSVPKFQVVVTGWETLEKQRRQQQKLETGIAHAKTEGGSVATEVCQKWHGGWFLSEGKTGQASHAGLLVLCQSRHIERSSVCP
jgi:hypothetical protein